MNFINNNRSQSQFLKSPEQRPSFDSEDDSDLSFGQSLLQFIWETVKVVVISLIIIIPVRYFLVQPFFVNGASMEPNFYDHEYLIINEVRYRFQSANRGDIIVFRYPRDPGQFFIKRIIGLPGETVRIQRGAVTIINDEYPQGVTLDESLYLPKGVSTRGDTTVTLADDEYYVLGDNRAASLDSRIFGPIKDKDIVGKAWLRGWPINRITVFETPEYNLP